MCHKLPCTNHINPKKINEWHDGDNEMCMFFSVFSTSPCDTCHQSLTKFVFDFNILFSNANTILIKSQNHQIWISSINTKTYSNPELKTFDFVNATINMSQHRSHKYALLHITKITLNAKIWTSRPKLRSLLQPSYTTIITCHWLVHKTLIYSKYQHFRTGEVLCDMRYLLAIL
jgi:hypothetical protein